MVIFCQPTHPAVFLYSYLPMVCSVLLASLLCLPIYPPTVRYIYTKCTLLVFCACIIITIASLLCYLVYTACLACLYPVMLLSLSIACYAYLQHEYLSAPCAQLYLSSLTVRQTNSFQLYTVNSVPLCCCQNTSSHEVNG